MRDFQIELGPFCVHTGAIGSDRETILSLLSFVCRIENKIVHIRQVCVKNANYLAEIIITLFFLMGSDIKVIIT